MLISVAQLWEMVKYFPLAAYSEIAVYQTEPVLLALADKIHLKEGANHT